MADHNVRGDLRVRGSITVDGAGGSGLGGEYLHVRNEQLAGTDGGGVTAATWSTGVLNTIVTNTLTGASLSSNQITLPAGDYYIFSISVHYDGNASMRGQSRLRNITSSETIIQGTNFFKGTFVHMHSLTSGQFTLGATSVLELQYLHDVSLGAGNEQGVQVNSEISGGVDKEVYTSVEIWRL